MCCRKKFFISLFMCELFCARSLDTFCFAKASQNTRDERRLENLDLVKSEAGNPLVPSDPTKPVGRRRIVSREEHRIEYHGARRDAAARESEDKIAKAALDYMCTSLPVYTQEFDIKNTLYSSYLPNRYKKLEKYFLQNGLSATQEYINKDTDVGSSLFIMTNTEPFKILAYSRKPEFIGLGAQELQKQILSGDIPDIFKQIVSTARKGVDFVAYNLKLAGQLDPFHVTFTKLNKNYVLGVTANVSHVDACFIVPYRTNAMAKRIKKDGLEQAIPLMNDDIDKTGYFYILECVEPYRLMTHGGNSKLVMQPAHDSAKLLLKQCPIGFCAGEELMKKLAALAVHGGGFLAYVWRSDENTPLYLKTAYVQPIRYCGKTYCLASSFSPLKTADNLRDRLYNSFVRMKELINTVGLENAGVIFQKERNDAFFPFVRATSPPYAAVIGGTKSLDSQTAFASQQFLKDRRDDFDALKTLKDIIWYAKTYGGFYAFAWRKTPGQSLTLCITYVETITYNGKEYYIGMGHWVP